MVERKAREQKVTGIKWKVCGESEREREGDGGREGREGRRKMQVQGKRRGTEAREQLT